MKYVALLALLGIAISAENSASMEASNTSGVRRSLNPNLIRKDKNSVSFAANQTLLEDNNAKKGRSFFDMSDKDKKKFDHIDPIKEVKDKAPIDDIDAIVDNVLLASKLPQSSLKPMGPTNFTKACVDLRNLISTIEKEELRQKATRVLESIQNGSVINKDTADIIAQYKKSVEDLQEQLAVTTSELLTVRNEKDRFKIIVQSKESHNNEAREANAFEKSINTLRDELVTINEENRVLKRKIQGYVSQSSTTQNRESALNEQISELGRLNDNLSKRITDIIDAVANANNPQVLRSVLNIVNDSKTYKISDPFAEYRLKIRQLKEQIEKLSAKKDAIDFELSDDDLTNLFAFIRSLYGEGENQDAEAIVNRSEFLKAIVNDIGDEKIISELRQQNGYASLNEQLKAENAQLQNAMQEMSERAEILQARIDLLESHENNSVKELANKLRTIERTHQQELDRLADEHAREILLLREELRRTKLDAQSRLERAVTSSRENANHIGEFDNNHFEQAQYHNQGENEDEDSVGEEEQQLNSRPISRLQRPQSSGGTGQQKPQNSVKPLQVEKPRVFNRDLLNKK